MNSMQTLNREQRLQVQSILLNVKSFPEQAWMRELLEGASACRDLDTHAAVHLALDALEEACNLYWMERISGATAEWVLTCSEWLFEYCEGAPRTPAIENVYCEFEEKAYSLVLSFEKRGYASGGWVHE